MYDEKNTGTNLPAQIDITAVDGDEYSFLFIAKGGGSANKTYLFQETKAVLNPAALQKFLIGKMKAIGTAACPPYHLAVVVGGTSAELVLKTVKLASARYLDHLPTAGGPGGHAFRDLELEAKLLEASRKLGLGAGFGGKYFCLDVRVIRLPRHGASCPIGMGVSCNADRNIKAKITRDGIFLERTREGSGQVPPRPGRRGRGRRPDRPQPPDERDPGDAQPVSRGDAPVARRARSSSPVTSPTPSSRRRSTGARTCRPISRTTSSITPARPRRRRAIASGSFGPTTAGRMDDYVPLFQKMGGSLVMLAKGNRSKGVTESCKTNGGFYLGSIGGPAARLAKDCITSQEVVAYPELGMEAIFRITVKDFPAFIIVDDKGNDFYEKILT